MTTTMPMIHLNGTSRSALLAGYILAADSVMKAIEDLDAGAPNARDYYPLGSDAFGKARDAHVSRHARLAAVRAELLEIAEHIAGDG